MAKPGPSVQPLEGLAPWIGGKRNLAKRIVTAIEAIPHHCYAEPFLGMGGVFFRRSLAAKAEVLNDESSEVVNLFRVVKHHPDALLEELSFQLASRAEFIRLLKVEPMTLTDVQRAARFYWVQRHCFGGKPTSRSFPVRPRQSKGLARDVFRKHIEAAYRRLARVTVEHLSYHEFIARYDRPGTLFYCDPPYYGCERYYGDGLFERSDFTRLSEQLAAIKGRFILSLNSLPETRELFGRFDVQELEMFYSVSVGKERSGFRELLITGP